MNQLRILEIRGIRNILECSSLISTIANTCPYLRKLDISTSDPFSSNINNDNNNLYLTDALLYELTSQCPNLEILAIGGHNQLTDNGVAFALQYIPKLTKFNVQGCRNIGDKTINTIIQYNLPITELRFGMNNINFTDNGLLNLLSSSIIQSNLMYLDLYGCRKLTIHGLETSLLIWYTNLQQYKDTKDIVSTTTTLHSSSSSIIPKIYIGGIPLLRNYVQDISKHTDTRIMNIASTIQILAH